MRFQSKSAILLVAIMIVASLTPLAEYNHTTINLEDIEEGKILFSSSNPSLHIDFDWSSSGGGNDNDKIHDIKIQEDGSYIIAGTFSGSATFGSTQLNSLGGKDIFVAKMDADGNWIWAISAGTTQDDEALGVGLGENSTIRIAGVYCDINSGCTWNGSSYPVATFGNHTLTSQSPHGNAFVAAVNQSGDWDWASKIKSNSLGKSFDVAVDPSGISYVIGHMSTNGDAACGNYYTGGFGSALFVAKFDSIGTCVWTKRAGNTGANDIWNPDIPSDILIDDEGSILISGKLVTTGLFGGITTPNNGSDDAFLAKISPSGTWTFATTFGSNGDDMATGMEIDDAGNLYITGYYSGSLTLGTSTLSHNGSKDIFVTKFSNTQSWEWASSSDSPFGSSEESTGLTISEDENIFITGIFSGTNVKFGSNIINLNSGQDIFISALDNQGNWLWADGASGTSTDSSNTIASLANDVTISGSFKSTNLEFSDGSFLNNPVTNYDQSFISKWSEVIIGINSISPQNNIGAINSATINGWGFDKLPKYTKEIDITNDFNIPVQDYSIFVENPTYNETDLVASYHFEDDDLVGVKDTNGNELDGTIIGNPTHDEGVNSGNSLDLDGANDIVQIPDDDLLDLGGEDFTVMLWARRDGGNSNSAGNEGLLTKNDVSNYNGYSLVIPVVGGGTSVTYSCLCGSQYIQTSLGKDVGIWHHIGMTYDHSTRTVQMYADGVADGSGTATITENDIDLILGSFYNGAPSTRWNGAIDDVKIYSRALSSLEIASYVNADIRYDYGDIRFIDSDGTPLDYEMLSDGNFMINIPSMSALETRTIHMTYGAFGLESESQPLDEWSLNNSSTTITPLISYDFEDAYAVNPPPSQSTCYNLVNDSSGNQNHGTVYGNENQCGVNGFDGDGIKLQEASNDYIEIDSGDWQNSSVATVSYHVNLTGFTHTGGEVVGFASDESYNNGIRAGISLGITANGNVECQVGDSVSTTAPSIVTTNLSLTTGVWYHLLCSWDNSTLRLYVDGLLSHTHTPTPGSFNGMSWGPGFSGPGPALLGKYSTHFTGSNTMYTAYSDALYDNFAYYDYALPDDVVQELFGQSIIWPTTINNHGVLGSGAYYDYDLLLINGTSDYDSLNNFVIVNETTITATIPSNLNLAGSGFYDVLLNGDGDVEICRLADGFEFIITDADGDGWADDVDAFPNDSTQWQDSDGDGYGDNLAGNNSDAFPYDATQWQDSDGDGYGDNLTGNNPDIFPSEPSQWNDTDSDGYGDNQSGFEPDDCVSVWGNSTNGRFGCPDDDGDGLANIDDAFPDDPLRGGDTDLDGYDDALDDDCPLIWGNSTIDRIGCVDADGDGYSDGDLNWTVVNGSDAFPSEVSQWVDSDGDGYGDNSTGFEGDQCPQVWGNSTIGQLGCPDNDGDGLSNTEDDCPDSNNSISSTDTDGDGCLDGEDAFPDDSTEHEDSDGDGIGDNSDPEPGVPLDSDGDGYPDRPGYADSDDCPQISGNSTGELVGCLDTDGDGLADTIDAFPNDGTRTTDTDLDGYDDLIEDDCTDEWGNSTIDLLGCLDSDGDGVSDINDLFPEDSTDWNDDDGDGVGNNSDVFPQDANETIDSDGDGVGDNTDFFPQDANETIDSDGDGVGDNEDQYPLQDNFIDTDNDGIFDVEDAFVTDPTQWQDADNDGYGDNLTGLLADLFPTDETQWFDLDGDGYGDNWGNETWNSTRLLIWPGMYMENASLADHCPDIWGNSSADGYFGCPDLDGDTIADIYDDEIDLGGENNQTQEVADGDNDGVTDLFDFCPNSQLGEIVDSNGCLADQDGDGVADSEDQCPNTQLDVEVNVGGCAISTNDESDTIIDELLAGDTDAIVRTVGIGAIIIAVIGFMQTNFIAAMLPDAFRWVQVFRKKSKLSAEEEMELGHLQSVVQAYFNDVDELKEELFNLKSDLTARFTNGEIKADTRKLIFTLIGELLIMESAELKRIAHDDRFFGLAGTTDTKERLEMLEIEKAMRSFDEDSGHEETDSIGSDFLDKNSPSPETKGVINEDDGHEYIEHPADSGRWFIRNYRTNMWDEWKD